MQPPSTPMLFAHAFGVPRFLPRWLSWSFVTQSGFAVRPEQSCCDASREAHT